MNTTRPLNEINFNTIWAGEIFEGVAILEAEGVDIEDELRLLNEAKKLMHSCQLPCIGGVVSLVCSVACEIIPCTPACAPQGCFVMGAGCCIIAAYNFCQNTASARDKMKSAISGLSSKAERVLASQVQQV